MTVAMISAHRSGVGQDKALENTLAAVERAAAAGFAYVEFDVQRLADGTLITYHDHRATVGGRRVPISSLTWTDVISAGLTCANLDDVLSALAGRTRAHVDLKFTSPDYLYARAQHTYEVDAVTRIIAALGAENVIVTTMEDRSVQAVRAWSRVHAPDLLVGLSLGRDDFGPNPIRQIRLRMGELFPGRRVRRCDANLIVANYRLAHLTLARFAARRRLPLLVWTVDSESSLRRWLADTRVWMVTTNYPERAALLRSSLGLE